MIRSYTDYSASERTLPAWQRTGVAVRAFGFLIERLKLVLAAPTEAPVPDSGGCLPTDELVGAVGQYDGLEHDQEFRRIGHHRFLGAGQDMDNKQRRRQ
jgi:putative membrane protein